MRHGARECVIPPPLTDDDEFRCPGCGRLWIYAPDAVLPDGKTVFGGWSCNLPQKEKVEA